MLEVVEVTGGKSSLFASLYQVLRGATCVELSTRWLCFLQGFFNLYSRSSCETQQALDCFGLPCVAHSC